MRTAQILYCNCPRSCTPLCFSRKVIWELATTGAGLSLPLLTERDHGRDISNARWSPEFPGHTGDDENLPYGCAEIKEWADRVLVLLPRALSDGHSLENQAH
jgi:hypothetical protein